MCEIGMRKYREEDGRLLCFKQSWTSSPMQFQ
jgi:hypothetical protein